MKDKHLQIGGLTLIRSDRNGRSYHYALFFKKIFVCLMIESFFSPTFPAGVSIYPN